MLPIIKERNTPDILITACQRFDLNPADVKLLDSFENFVYTVDTETPRILRLAHTLRRSRAAIDAELDWISYLADRGVSVARPLPSPQGLLCEALDDGAGEFFLAALFEKAAGKPLARTSWTTSQIQAWGALQASIHRASRTYTPKPGHVFRQYQQACHDDGIAHLGVADRDFALDALRSIGELCALPQSPEHFGLIHYDMHHGNFFADGDRLTLFDFDDCCFGWFPADIAIVVWHAVGVYSEATREFSEHFTINFLRGYRQESALPVEWADTIPGFLRYRDVEIFAALTRSQCAMGTSGEPAPQLVAFLERCRERIASRTPCLELDWNRLFLA